MSADGIFLQVEGGLAALKPGSYDSEAVLQEALALYPEFIAGPTTTGTTESRLLLVRREMPISSSGGISTFSLDHLFLDSDGVPVLVEVKRASDTRIRREVVGQMLDYAANALRYWPVSSLQDALARTAQEAGVDADVLLSDLQPALEPEDFWKTVETNLAAGRLRLLFVADELPDELVRIIEFLNEQMSPVEVLGVELRLYVGDGHRVYVPRLIGRTASAVQAKSPGRGRRWDRESFLAAANARCPEQEVALVQRLLQDVDERGMRLAWGNGATPGVGGWYTLAGRPTAVWTLNVGDESPSTRAALAFYLGDIVKRLPPERVARAATILARIPVLAPKIAEARASSWNRYPSLPLREAVDDSDHPEAIFAAIGDLLLPA